MYNVVIVSSYPTTNPGCGVGIYVKNLWRELNRFPMVDDLYVCSYGDKRPEGLKEKVLDNTDDPVQIWFNQNNHKDVRRATGEIRKRAKASDNPTIVISMLEYGLTWNQRNGSDNAVYMGKHLKGKDFVTLGVAHTIRRTPDDNQREILIDTGNEYDSLIVHTDASKNVLRSDPYGLTCPIQQVDHGTRYVDRSNRDRKIIKRRMGAEAYTIISSVGLRGPGKGTDYFARAVDLFMKSLSYSQRRKFKIIRAGGYHSKFVEAEGGKYWREHVDYMQQTLSDTSLRLICQPHDNINGIEWESGEYFSVESFLDTRPYMDVLGSTNVAVFTYPDPQQDTSGTLADAMGWGRAIASTDFAFAKEMIGCKNPQKKGVMNKGDPEARGLLTHCGKQCIEETAEALDYWLVSKGGQDLRSHYELNAHVRGHDTQWSNSAWKMLQHADFIHAEKNTTRGRGNRHIRTQPKQNFAKSNPN